MPIWASLQAGYVTNQTSKVRSQKESCDWLTLELLTPKYERPRVDSVIMETSV